MMRKKHEKGKEIKDVHRHKEENHEPETNIRVRVNRQTVRR